MSVNGFDDSKNKKEVYTKEEADVRYVLKGDFAVITVTAGSNNLALVDYPEGFNKDNTVVLSVCNGYTYHPQVTSNGVATETEGILLELNRIQLTDNDIQIQRAFPTGTYKITLMKYEVLDSEYTLGDVNQDGQITQEDKDILDDHVLNGTALTEQQLKAADINKDGYVDTGDTFKLQQYLNGAIDSLE